MMRERLAKLLYDRAGFEKPWEIGKVYYKSEFFDDADAILDALMEPSEEMVRAADGALDDYFNGTKDAPIEGAFRATFRAMIKAAKEG
jgi:hypothetical protein